MNAESPPVSVLTNWLTRLSTGAHLSYS